MLPKTRRRDNNQPPPTRNTTRRDRHRRTVAQGKPDCWHCGQPIDYTAHHLDPLSYQIDHVIPLARGGPDDLYLEDGTPQIVAAHRKCNRDKSDNMPDDNQPSDEPDSGITYVTDRQW